MSSPTKILRPLFALPLTLSFSFGQVPAPSPAPSAQAVAAPNEHMPSPLKFDRMKLGNVVRILSARLNLPVTIEAKAEVEITGDYSHMDLRKALSDAAAQAGLVVVALGNNSLDGYTMMTPAAVSNLDRDPRGAVEALMVVARPVGSPEDMRSFLLESARRRAALLKQRQALLEAEVRLAR